MLDAIEQAIGGRPTRDEPLAGGMFGDVRLIVSADGSSLVVKWWDSPEACFEIEATMLRHLRATCVVPVPEVIAVTGNLLNQEWMPGQHLAPDADAHAGQLVAALHGVTADAVGFGSDTANGSFILHNAGFDSWISFYRDTRLVPGAEAAAANGRLRASDRRRVDQLIADLPELIDEPDAPRLLHGDLWRANVLSSGDRVTGLLDPSCVYGHPELDLAYAAGFGELTPAFFDAYHACAPIDPDFWSRRRYAYAIYPALMHVYYFGNRCRPYLDRALSALGY